MGEQKEMVTKSKQDFNNIKKHHKKCWESSRIFIVKVDVKEFLFLTIFVSQVNLLSVTLTNKIPCGRK